MFEINKYTGEFINSETEKEFLAFSWPELSKRLLIAVLLSSLTYFFASCIARPDVNPEYRVLMIPLTRIVAGFILFIAVVVKKSRYFSYLLRVFVILAEIFIGLLESADQFFYL
ncbi:MAG: hybrid sensor histidine kinase/response regulator, partial [Spirochaetales bacterium]|nr:hybrid sensor histidine kinase/response regulator [Spirochaetales bacterium]